MNRFPTAVLPWESPFTRRSVTRGNFSWRNLFVTCRLILPVVFVLLFKVEAIRRLPLRSFLIGTPQFSCRTP